MTEQLSQLSQLPNIPPRDFIKQSMALAMGPCLVAGAIDMALKALQDKDKKPTQSTKLWKTSSITICYLCDPFSNQHLTPHSVAHDFPHLW